MRKPFGLFHTWYKYINMYPPLCTVRCIRIWKRFIGETEKQAFFKKSKPYPPLCTVPYPLSELAFDFVPSDFGLNEAKRILKRESAHQIGVFSKKIKLNWPWKNASEATLYDDRSIDSPEKTGQRTSKESKANGVWDRPPQDSFAGSPLESASSKRYYVNYVLLIINKLRAILDNGKIIRAIGRIYPKRGRKIARFGFSPSQYGHIMRIISHEGFYKTARHSLPLSRQEPLSREQEPST
jgi:hypothetical protein